LNAAVGSSSLVNKGAHVPQWSPALDAVCRRLVGFNISTLQWWLGALLVAMLALTAVYDWRVLMIVRGRQILMSVIGLATYVFALGGWFATMTWY
jgi:hypothetical protein